MMTITRITNVDNKKHIAILETSSISFMQGVEAKGILSDYILKDYDLILIPEWVLVEINEKEECRRGFYHNFGRSGFLVLSGNRGADYILTR